MDRVVVALVLLLAGCSASTSPPGGDAPPAGSPREQMVADLKQYHGVVTTTWAYLTTKQDRQQVDITAARDRLIARVTDETTDAEFAQILREFAASLKDGHSQVFTGDLDVPKPNTWPIGFTVVQNEIVVANLNWLANNPGVKLGDRLMRVNGESIDDVVQREMALTSASTDTARRILAVDQLHGTRHNTVRLALAQRDGGIFEVDLPCIPDRIDFRFRKRTEFCRLERLDERVGVLRIPQFTWNESAFSRATTDQEREAAIAGAKRQIDEAFQQAEGLQGLILDLRGNAGGYELLSSYVAEHLVPGDFLYWISTRHDSDVVRALPCFQDLDASYFGVPVPQYPRRWTAFRHVDGASFSGRLIVLINPRCFSTTDNLCAFLRDSRPQTQFVGEPTGAGTGEPLIVAKLSHSGAQVQFCISRVQSPNGRLIEGVGTVPDHLIEPTRDDVIHRRDPALEAAQSLLSTQH